MGRSEASTLGMLTTSSSEQITMTLTTATATTIRPSLRSSYGSPSSTETTTQVTSSTSPVPQNGEVAGAVAFGYAGQGRFDTAKHGHALALRLNWEFDQALRERATFQSLVL